MSSLLAHIKITEGYEQKFEDVSRELYKKSYENPITVYYCILLYITVYYCK